MYVPQVPTIPNFPNNPTAIGKYKPQDATTNPSLILAASKKPEYAKLIDVAVAYGKEHGSTIDEKVDTALDRLLVEFGKEILAIIPGKVSTEVDARFSFDTKLCVEKALHIIEVSSFPAIMAGAVIATLGNSNLEVLDEILSHTA